MSFYVFFISGDGYCRSEGIIAIYLQKHKDAKRIYCTIVHSKTDSVATRKKVNIKQGPRQQGTR